MADKAKPMEWEMYDGNAFDKEHKMASKFHKCSTQLSHKLDRKLPEIWLRRFPGDGNNEEGFGPWCMSGASYKYELAENGSPDYMIYRHILRSDSGAYFRRMPGVVPLRVKAYLSKHHASNYAVEVLSDLDGQAVTTIYIDRQARYGAFRSAVVSAIVATDRMSKANPVTFPGIDPTNTMSHNSKITAMLKPDICNDEQEAKFFPWYCEEPEAKRTKLSEKAVAK